MATADSLEDVLRQVESFGGDLSAEIVVQEEKWHTEIEFTETDAVLKWGDPGSPVKIIDKPRITKPDTQKREAAKQKLKQIYDSSEWYSARYNSGKALGSEVNNNLIDWISQLEKDIISTKTDMIKFKVGTHTEQVEVSEQVLDSRYTWGSTPITETSIQDVKVEDYKEKLVIVPDEIVREKALKDISKLYRRSNSQQLKELLIKAYKENDSKEIRVTAGRELGYSNLRIRAHEHPIAATVSGIATAGVASSLGYMLYQYVRN